MNVLETPPGTTTGVAQDVNDQGVVVGEICQPCQSVTWLNGRYLGPVATPAGSEARATAINPRGQLAGYAVPLEGGRYQAVRWTRGQPEALESPGDGNALGFGINDQGSLVGYTETPVGV